MPLSDADRHSRWAALVVHREQLLRVARRRTDSLEDAEDCVQEALARAVEHPGLDLTRAGAFLTTTTIRLTADLHRARQRQALLQARIQGQRVPSADHVEDLADRSLAHWLAQQATELSGQERAVLRSRVAGETSREAAETLGISVRAAESSFTRVRTKLQTAWTRVAVVVGALWLATRRHAQVAVPIAAVAVSVSLTPVLLPSTSPVAPLHGQSRPVQAAAPAPTAAVVAVHAAPAAPATTAARAVPAPAAPSPAAPSPSPTRWWQHGDQGQECESDCQLVPLVLKGTWELIVPSPGATPKPFWRRG